MLYICRMETTFDKFITNNVKQKALFDKEYAEFLRSESLLENLDRERQTKQFQTNEENTILQLIIAAARIL